MHPYLIYIEKKKKNRSWLFLIYCPGFSSFISLLFNGGIKCCDNNYVMYLKRTYIELVKVKKLTLVVTSD